MYLKHNTNIKQPLTRFILQLLHSLDGAIVVIKINRAHHLASFDITNTQADAADHVAVDQLDYLRGCRELRVDLRPLYAISPYLVGARCYMQR